MDVDAAWAKRLGIHDAGMFVERPQASDTEIAALDVLARTDEITELHVEFEARTAEVEVIELTRFEARAYRELHAAIRELETTWTVVVSLQYSGRASLFDFPVKLPGGRSPVPTEMRGIRLARDVGDATDYQIVLEQAGGSATTLTHVVYLTRGDRLSDAMVRKWVGQAADISESFLAKVAEQ